MRAIAGAVGERLGHRGGNQPLLLGVVFGHEAEERHAIARRERVRIGEIELVLAIGVFMVE